MPTRVMPDAWSLRSRHLSRHGQASVIADVRQKMKNLALSLRIFLVHTGLVAVSFLLIVSPLGHKPGAIHPLLVLPLFYLICSGAPYSVSLVRSVYELVRKCKKKGSLVALLLNVVVLFAGIFVVSRMWPMWMSV